MPDLLQEKIPQPNSISPLLEFRVAHYPLFIGLKTGTFKVGTPLADQSLNVALIYFFFAGFRSELMGFPFDVLSKSFVEFPEGVDHAIQLFSHHLAQYPQSLPSILLVLVFREASF